MIEDILGKIPLETDYRIFTPVARDSKKFKKK